MKRKVRSVVGLVVVGLLLAGGGWHFLRKLLRPAVLPPDAPTLAQAQRVRILRDKFGVPHIFGQSDADAAFGLAYANAEDDFPTMQLVLAAARGKLALLLLSKDALINDYYVHLVHVPEEVDAEYEQLAPETRALLEGYARGLNLYAFRHPKEVDSRLLPYRGRDVAAGFAHKLPLMIDLPGVLRALDAPTAKLVGDKLALTRPAEERAFPASNSHAVAHSRSTDDRTRLNVNSHQPWEGPVTWFEAQVVSQEGWNMTGGTFPGAPVILHGHNDHLGWAHTVNLPDLVDVYRLEMNPNNPNEYRFEGKWRALERESAPIEVDTGLFELTVHKDVLHSVHGPVFETKQGFFAIRYAGAERRVHAVEQWYRMNKARDFDEWKAAMSMQAIPMFNTTYADYANIFYVYNALLPLRLEGFDYKTVLPGDRADLIWNDYVPFDRLPQVRNPPSGFVANCNGTPFRATTGAGNPRREDFPAADGIEDTVNNRTLRTLALFGAAGPISGDDFLRFKWDRAYDAESHLALDVLAPLLHGYAAVDEDEKQALALLRGWNRVADENSPAATLAILIGQPVLSPPHGEKAPTPVEAFHKAIKLLKKYYGRVDVPLGTVQRLRHGAVDLPLGGGPDVLNAAQSKLVDGHLVGVTGDSYILEVAFGPDGPTGSQSIVQYGASNRPDSPHYSDQAPLFLQHKFKPAWRSEAEIRANLEREYFPGHEDDAAK